MKKFYLQLPDKDIVDFLIDKENDFAQIWLVGIEGTIKETHCFHVDEARRIFDNIKANHGGRELN